MTDRGDDIEHWSRIAAEWITWARSPSETFWGFRSSLRMFVGSGDGEALDVGCGEGRVSLLLKECGFHVTAVDPVAAFIAAAERSGSADRYAVAPAADLPFDSGSFDLVVAYNVLMDIDDMPQALSECRRVLRPSGTLIISVVHPFTDRGRFTGPEPNSPFLIESCYFDRQRFEGVDTHDGLQMHFAGWSLPLESYATALADTGFAITSVREPRPAPACTVDAMERLERWRRLPLFLWLKARPFPVGSQSGFGR
jgi:SAM-dependent methyltransferase